MMAEEEKESSQGQAVDLSALGAMDFTPGWARGSKEEKVVFSRAESSRPRDERRSSQDEQTHEDRREERRGARRDRRTPRSEAWRSEARRENNRRDNGRGRNGERMAAHEFRSENNRSSDGGAPRMRPSRPTIQPLPLEIRILPEEKQLGEFFRIINNVPHRAYSVRQLAELFMTHENTMLLRLTCPTPQEGETPQPIQFFQCTACKFVAFSQEELMAHILSEHMEDYFESEVIDCEPPKGSFPCVARCGLTHEMLGPPNWHGFDARVKEMLRTKFPQMSEAAYRAHIEMVRESEAIEAWRQSETKRTIYRRRGEGTDDEPAPAVEREVAEMEFRTVFAPALISTPPVARLTVQLALTSKNQAFVYAVRNALRQEKQFPRSLMAAIRGSFHHRKLFFFRALRTNGPEYVTAFPPVPFDPTHAIKPLVELINFIDENPMLKPKEVVKALSQGDETKFESLKSHIMWMIDKGHVICYATGELVVAKPFPFWCSQGELKQRQAKRARLEQEAASAPVAAASVAETVLEAAPEPSPEPVPEPALEPPPAPEVEPVPEAVAPQEETATNEESKED